MRPFLRQTLERHQMFARGEAKENLLEENAARIRALRDHFFERHDRQEEIPVETQREVYRLQQQKNEIVRRLKGDLQRIDRNEPVSESSPEALPTRFEEGHLFAAWNGQEVPVTLGMMVGDLEWGIAYQLDPQTVPKSVRKRYALAAAREKMWPLVRRQIASYERFDRRLSEEEREWPMVLVDTAKMAEQPGILAERLSYAFAKRLEVDVPDALFSAQKADPYQDAVLKADFLVEVPAWVRAVRLKLSPAAGTFVQGFQLTLGTAKGKREVVKRTKERLQETQEGVDDLALVVIRTEPIVRAYDAWVRAGRPPGGPAQSFSAAEARDLFDTFAWDLLPEEGLANMHAYIDGAFSHDAPSGLDMVVSSPKKEFQASALAVQKRAEAERLRGEAIEAERQARKQREKAKHAAREEAARRKRQRRWEEEAFEEAWGTENRPSLERNEREAWLKLLCQEVVRLGERAKTFSPASIAQRQGDPGAFFKAIPDVASLSADFAEIAETQSVWEGICLEPESKKQCTACWKRFKEAKSRLERAGLLWDLLREAYTFEQERLSGVSHAEFFAEGFPELRRDFFKRLAESVPTFAEIASQAEEEKAFVRRGFRQAVQALGSGPLQGDAATLAKVRTLARVAAQQAIAYQRIELLKADALLRLNVSEAQKDLKSDASSAAGKRSIEGSFAGPVISAPQEPLFFATEAHRSALLSEFDRDVHPFFIQAGACRQFDRLGKAFQIERLREVSSGMPSVAAEGEQLLALVEGARESGADLGRRAALVETLSKRLVRVRRFNGLFTALLAAYDHGKERQDSAFGNWLASLPADVRGNVSVQALESQMSAKAAVRDFTRRMRRGLAHVEALYARAFNILWNPETVLKGGQADIEAAAVKMAQCILLREALQQAIEDVNPNDDRLAAEPLPQAA